MPPKGSVGTQLPKALGALVEAGKDLAKVTDAELKLLTREQKAGIAASMDYTFRKPGMEAQLKAYKSLPNDSERHKA